MNNLATCPPPKLYFKWGRREAPVLSRLKTPTLKEGVIEEGKFVCMVMSNILSWTF